MKPELVYVVDDDRALRDVLAMIFTSAGLAVELFASAAKFLSAATAAARSCLVLDMRLPDMSGSALQNLLIERGSAMPIIFLTGHGNVATAVEAMKNGAFDFIQKPFDCDALLTSVRNALDHCENQSPATRRTADFTGLSAREREVLELVLAGKPSRQIGEALFISTKTVDFHRARIMQKLDVRSAAQLFRLCLGRPARAG